MGIQFACRKNTINPKVDIINVVIFKGRGWEVKKTNKYKLVHVF